MRESCHFSMVSIVVLDQIHVETTFDIVLKIHHLIEILLNFLYTSFLFVLNLTYENQIILWFNIGVYQLIILMRLSCISMHYDKRLRLHTQKLEFFMIFVMNQRTIVTFTKFNIPLPTNWIFIGKLEQYHSNRTHNLWIRNHLLGRLIDTYVSPWSNQVGLFAIALFSPSKNTKILILKIVSLKNS